MRTGIKLTYQTTLSRFSHNVGIKSTGTDPSGVLMGHTYFKLSDVESSFNILFAICMLFTVHIIPLGIKTVKLFRLSLIQLTFRQKNVVPPETICNFMLIKQEMLQLQVSTYSTR